MSAAVRPGHEVRVLEAASDVARAAREEFIRAGQAAIEVRGRFTVALSGGATPKTLYGSLTPKDLEWGKVEVFFGDERCVSPERQESNFRMAQEALLSRVPVPEENVHRIRGEAESAEIAAAEYEAELRKVFGEGEGAPRFDLMLLGLGADGHTASLFPGSPALEENAALGRRELGAAALADADHPDVPGAEPLGRGPVPRRRRREGGSRAPRDRGRARRPRGARAPGRPAGRKGRVAARSALGDAAGAEELVTPRARRRARSNRSCRSLRPGSGQAG
jgi:6-phosphogluconolactonase